MALNTEIDALLDAADAQGITIDQLVAQVYLRSQSEAMPDVFTGIGFSDFMGSGNWPTLQAYLGDYTGTMPVDVAYSRAWSACVSREQAVFLQCLMQLLRCFARDFQYNVSYPSYAMKSSMLTGVSELAL